MKIPILVCIACSLGVAFAEPAAPAPAKPPAGVNPKLTSADATYGFSKDNPVQTGSKDEYGGPAAEREYLDTLRDEAGKPVAYSRSGSVGAGKDGHILDLYDLQTSTGRKLQLYIDMYHPKNDPKKQPAPAGLFKAK
ncbi:hypothetical protein [Luteolibacter sp. LG18]|uniref:hypothetical protein n=1 Tax=Luteolibacter sp. LG18 TaxID=2819286 RepID=UPI002B2B4904|nr:hypothetical protein llg_20280 [Luteolibacter sp. LG18]